MAEAETSDTKIALPAVSAIRRPKPSASAKVYKVCNSCLTDLIELDHVFPIYSIVWVVWILLAAQVIWKDFATEGSFYFCSRTFESGFRGIHYALACWCLQHIIIFLIYYGFKSWCYIYGSVQNIVWLRTIVNLGALLLYMLSQLAFACLAGSCALKLLHGLAPNIALIMETARLLLKMHAFMRTNTPKALKELQTCNSTCTTPKSALPTFSSFLYFLFAPTLIYCDEYPRATTSNIRWSFIARCVLEIVGVAFLLAFLCELYIHPRFHDFGKSPVSLIRVVDNLFAMLLPSVLMLLSWFYLILHAVQNLFAELLHFGDRCFYREWWNGYNYSIYFRQWNMLVQDWIYAYVYCDFTKYVWKSRLAGALAAITLSAVVHEIMNTIILGVFMPITYLLFGIIGVFLLHISFKFSRRFGNILLWFTLTVGMSIIISSYSMAYYAKANCPKEYRNLMDYATPIVWNCMTRNFE